MYPIPQSFSLKINKIINQSIDWLYQFKDRLTEDLKAYCLNRKQKQLYTKLSTCKRKWGFLIEIVQLWKYRCKISIITLTLLTRTIQLMIDQLAVKRITKYIKIVQMNDDFLNNIEFKQQVNKIVTIQQAIKVSIKLLGEKPIHILQDIQKPLLTNIKLILFNKASIVFQNSSLITSYTNQQKLLQMINIPIIKVQLIYRAGDYQFSIQRFWEVVQGLQSTLIIIRVKDLQANYKHFGAYTPLIQKKLLANIIISISLILPSCFSYSKIGSGSQRLELEEIYHCDFIWTRMGPAFSQASKPDLLICLKPYSSILPYKNCLRLGISINYTQSQIQPCKTLQKCLLFVNKKPQIKQYQIKQQQIFKLFDILYLT